MATINPLLPNSPVYPDNVTIIDDNFDALNTDKIESVSVDSTLSWDWTSWNPLWVDTSWVKIDPKVSTEVSNATPGINCDYYDIHTITALAVNATFTFPTWTPVEWRKIMFRIKDDWTSRTLAWNSIYRASTDLALPTATTISKTLYVWFVYNSTDSKWDLLALLNNI